MAGDNSVRRTSSKAALEAARQTDDAWRDRRQARALRLQGVLVGAAQTGMQVLAGLGTLLVLLLAGGSLLFMLALIPGWGELVPLGTVLVTVATFGLILLIVVGSAGWVVWTGCDRWFRSWARRQAIDLPENTRQTRRRRIT